jgi:hypothetical protein
MQGCHSTDKNVTYLERHFAKIFLPKERNSRPTERCVVCYKQNKGKKVVFGCPDSHGGLCFFLRLLQDIPHQAKLFTIFSGS